MLLLLIKSILKTIYLILQDHVKGNKPFYIFTRTTLETNNNQNANQDKLYYIVYYSAKILANTLA